MDVGPYLARRYDIERDNCWHFLRDVWLELTGVDLGDRTPDQITARSLIARFESDVPEFEKLPGPAEPSIVLMRRPRVVPHVGAYFDRRVLQMGMAGPSYLPLRIATSGFDTVEFYR